MVSISMGGLLPNTCDLTDPLNPGCRSQKLIDVVSEQLINDTLQNVTTQSTVLVTYYNCTSPDANTTTSQCSSLLEGDQCDPNYCCDNPTALTANQQSQNEFIIHMMSYHSSYQISDTQVSKFFTLGGSLPGTFCIDKTYKIGTTQVFEPDQKNSYGDLFNFASVLWVDKDMIRYQTRPRDGEWNITGVYWNVTNKFTNATLQSVFMTIRHVCQPGKDGMIFHYSENSFKGDYYNRIRGQAMQIVYEKGQVACRTSDQSGSPTYTWSIDDSNNLLHSSNFTENSTHIVLDLVNPYFQAYNWYTWGPIMTDDQTGQKFTTYKRYYINLFCANDATQYTALPDSSDFQGGFPYSQTYHLGSGGSAIFIFKDPSSSLVVAHPETNCVIKDRVIQYQDSDLNVTNLNIVGNSSDGNISIEFNGSLTEKTNIKFQVQVIDLGSQSFLVKGLQFNIECGEISNNVTSGPFDKTVYEEVVPNFYHKIPKFEEVAVEVCKINGYKIVEATIQVYDAFDKLLETLTDTLSEFTQVMQNGEFIEIYIKSHGNSKRVYFFKVQGLLDDLVLHTTEEITVTVKNNIQFVQPQNATFVNVTGSTTYIVPKSLVLFDNPTYQVTGFSIVGLSAEILHENDELLSMTNTTFTLDDDSSSSEVIITFPAHCDFGRVYTFIMKAETSGSLMVCSESISVKSYNNMTLNADLKTPVILQVDQYSEGLSYNFSQYLLINQPGCIFQAMVVVDIYNPSSLSNMPGQDVKDMMKFDEKNLLQLLNTQVSRANLKIYVAATFSQDLVYSFNSFYLIDLSIKHVIMDTDIKTNIKPIFDTLPENLHIEVESNSQQNTFLIPVIIDEDPSSVKFDIKLGFNDSFMTLGAREILFDRFSKDSQGNHSLQFRLTDSKGNFNDYNWTVTIDYLVEEEEEQLQVVLEKLTKIQGHFVAEEWVSNNDAEFERKPIEIRVKNFDENGVLTLKYSEELYPIEHFKEYGVNLTSLNKNITSIIQLDYNCRKQRDPDSIKDPEEKFPELVKYQIKEFTSHTLVLKLDFKNPLYVSSYGQKDLIFITFRANVLFSSIVDQFFLRANYTLNRIDVPTQMASEQDFMTLTSIGRTSEKSMLLSLLIPLIFMVFMSASMDRVWSFYNMLQLSTNLVNYNTLHVPANQTFLTNVVKNVALFKLFENEFVQSWLEKYIFGRFQALQRLIFSQGPLVTGTIFCSVMILFAFLGQKVRVFRDIALKLKKKMMWNSFLRGQIQMYFPTALMTLATLKSFYGKPKPEEEKLDDNEQFHSESGRLLEQVNYEWLEAEKTPSAQFTALFQLAIIVFLPIFSHYFLKRNKFLLQDPDFQAKYLSLYNSLKQQQRSVYKHTFYFTLRRLFITFFTIYLNSYLILNIYIGFFSSLFAIKYLFQNNPFQDKINNSFEKMNEIFTLFLCYTLIVYSNFVLDPEAKYNIGWCFVYAIMLIGGINISLISYDLVIGVYQQVCKDKYQRKWKEHEEMMQKMARYIVYDAMKKDKQLIQSKKEMQLFILHVRFEYSVSEMTSKIKEIQEKALAKPAVSPNDVSIEDLPEAHPAPYTREDYNFKKWYFKTKMNVDPRDPILIEEEHRPEDTPQQNPKPTAPVETETPRFQEELVLNEIATVQALVKLQKDFEASQLNCLRFKDRIDLEIEYRENQEKIVRDEMRVEKYIEQQNKGLPEVIKKESLNQDFIKMKVKR